MLGAIESLMSAVVSDRMSNDRHNPNVELVAQGVANVVSPMFGGLPATGAIARTATNIRSGAQSPVAGIVHSLTLLAILLFAAPVVSFVPMAVLAGILMVVAYNMGEWMEIPSLLKLDDEDHDLEGELVVGPEQPDDEILGAGRLMVDDELADRGEQRGPAEEARDELRQADRGQDGDRTGDRRPEDGRRPAGVLDGGRGALRARQGEVAHCCDSSSRR